AYVELLKEIIVDENFTFVKFYKKIDFPFVQKAKAEEVLYKALETVASENNTKAQKLLVNFNELINSTSVKIYWNSVYVRDERDKTKLFRTILKEKLDQEDCQIKSNVLDEHIIESDFLLKRKRQNLGEGCSTPLNKAKSSSSDSEAVPILLTNVFLEVKDSGVGDDNNILESVDNYDNNVDNNEQSNPEVYQSPILDNNILESVNHEVQQTPIPESVDNNKENDSVPKRKVTRSKPKYIQHDLAQELLTNLRLCPLKGHKWLWEDIDIINLFKNNKNTKTPLSIGVANFHNNSCVQHLPPSMITYIQKQMENDEDTIYFDNEKKVGIDKFAIDVEDEVMEFLNKFRDCKGDIRFSSGEVSSIAYDKLKKLAQIQSKSGPRMDSRATIMSVSQEVLIQENGRYDNANKRKNDLTKLEYCSKVLLTSAYLALPTVARPDIHKFEIYLIQTNASYVFENTICMLGLTDIIIPRTVDAFPKCVEAACKVLSWKARSRNNTKIFHELIGQSTSQLHERKYFTPKKLAFV
ncbi:4848_t:CDS:2, partial [Gigaspora rosea]